MLYLIQNFLKQTQKFPLVSGAFFITTVFLCFTLSSERLEGLTSPLQSQAFEKRDSFRALGTLRSSKKIFLEKIESLPGVSEIKIIQKKALLHEIQSAMKDFEMSLGPEKVFSQTLGFTLFFSLGTSSHSQEIIRQYIQKYFGKEQVILSKTQKGVEKIDQGPSWDLILMLCAFFLWSITFFLFSFRLSPYLNMMQRFQRKRGLHFSHFTLSFYFPYGLCLLFLVSFDSQFFDFKFSIIPLMIFPALLMGQHLLKAKTI